MRGCSEVGDVDVESLIWALDRLALGFESADPHIRHEAKMVAKQDIAEIANQITGCSILTDGGISFSGDDGDRPDENEMVEHVSILEYTEEAANYDRTPGEKIILGGVRRNQHVRDEEQEGFVEIADGVAVIELYQPIPEENVTEWCNSPAGKLALSHWYDHTDPEEVVTT